MLYLQGLRLQHWLRQLRPYFLSKPHRSQRKAAFVHFRKKGSEWFHDDTYLFVYDLNANVLLNPAFPKA